MYRVTLELSDKEFAAFLKSNPKGWMKVESNAVAHDAIEGAVARDYSSPSSAIYTPQRRKRRTKAEMEAAAREAAQ